jgi:hypothetical protein
VSWTTVPRPPETARRAALSGGLRLVPLGARRCRHIHESTTLYDRDQKQLSFLLVCRVCGTERLVLGSRTNPALSLSRPGSSRREATGSAVEQQRDAPDQDGTR